VLGIFSGIRIIPDVRRSRGIRQRFDYTEVSLEILEFSDIYDGGSLIEYDDSERVTQ